MPTQLAILDVPETRFEFVTNSSETVVLPLTSAPLQRIWVINIWEIKKASATTSTFNFKLHVKYYST